MPAEPDEARLRAETLAVVAGRGERQPDDPLNPPLVMASTYVAGGRRAYSRGGGNPTWEALEDAVGLLEGGTAVCYSSGMGAVDAVLDDLRPGAVVVYPEVAYVNMRANVTQRDRDGRLSARAVDITDTDATLAACEGAQLLWIESPTNPMLGVADVPALVSGAKRRGLDVAFDNTFATPLIQRPLEHGVDVVVHSATKLIGGHSDLLLGLAICADRNRAERLREGQHLAGSTPGTLEAWLALRGLRTLHLRLERAQSNALELARRLGSHPEVEGVRYPGLEDDPGHRRAREQMDGFGAMVAFEPRGGAERADAICERVRVLVHATSLGGVETLIERRAKLRGEELVPAALLRVSVGCEHVDDLWDDLAAALDATG
jgi:cystathionine gamma-synthase